MGAVAVEVAEPGAGGCGGGGGGRHPYPETLLPRPGLPCVLIVEDEPGLRELYEQILTFEGFARRQWRRRISMWLSHGL